MTLEERFWQKVDRGSADECWEWTAYVMPEGYGQIGSDGPTKGSRMLLAHRVSYELHFGPIPKGEGYHGTVIRHTCDNRSCVNPNHLKLGTQADNLQDMRDKGRQNRGDRNAQSKLTEEQVLEIRKRHSLGNISQALLARDFGVRKNTINRIINRKTWTHLEGGA